MQQNERETAFSKSPMLDLRQKTTRNAQQFFGKLAIFQTYTHNWRLFAIAAIVGVFPLLAAKIGGWTQHQIASALLMLPFFWSLVLQKRFVAGVMFFAAVYIFHGIVSIWLTVQNPSEMSQFFPGGEAYWQQTLTWIKTGVDPEYEPRNWLPEHCLLLVGVAIFSVATLGLVPFHQGFFETDLMNFYVGNLLAISENDTTALLAGWHAWSVMRGICYSIIVFEMVSWTVEKLTETELSSPSDRRKRLLLGLFFFLADVALKFFITENVRQVLSQNLVQ